MFPGFAQHSGVKELQAIEIELYRAPGANFEQVAEILEELVCVQVIASPVKIVAYPPDSRE